MMKFCTSGVLVNSLFLCAYEQATNLLGSMKFEVVKNWKSPEVLDRGATVKIALKFLFALIKSRFNKHPMVHYTTVCQHLFFNIGPLQPHLSDLFDSFNQSVVGVSRAVINEIHVWWYDSRFLATCQSASGQKTEPQSPGALIAAAHQQEFPQ